MPKHPIIELRTGDSVLAEWTRFFQRFNVPHVSGRTGVSRYFLPNNMRYLGMRTKEVWGGTREMHLFQYPVKNYRHWGSDKCDWFDISFEKHQLINVHELEIHNEQAQS